MLLMAVALLSAITTMHFAIHGAEVQDPGAEGDDRRRGAQPGSGHGPQSRCRQPLLLRGRGRRAHSVAVACRRARWCVANGMCASPKAWDRRKVDVPDTVGTEARVAALRLRRAGLEVGVTAKLPYAGAEDGTVLAQDPPAHAQGIAQPSVNLLVAAPDNAAPDGYVMPDLTGIPVVTAQVAAQQSRPEVGYTHVCRYVSCRRWVTATSTASPLRLLPAP